MKFLPSKVDSVMWIPFHVVAFFHAFAQRFHTFVYWRELTAFLLLLFCAKMKNIIKVVVRVWRRVRVRMTIKRATLYNVLLVKENATEAQIKKAYHRLSLKRIRTASSTVAG